MRNGMITLTIKLIFGKVGSLEFEVLPELYWKDHYYTKLEIKPLIDLVRGLGMQVIPMFNHLGHASGSRECFGRHVILNQNPKLALLFEPDGWSWCLSNPKTLKLLEKIREELMDLCGEGDYLLIGGDDSLCPYSQTLPGPRL